MRIILSWLDQLRKTTIDGLPSFCSAIVSQFEEIVGAANQWASIDHNPDGTHDVVHHAVTTEPNATSGALSTWWDGTNLKYKKPDGTTGNIV